MKPHLKEQYVIPPHQNADFVAHMEDVLEVYHRPYDPKRPQVCMDEQPVQLIKQTRVPLPAVPGRPFCEDYEYERNGTANIFLFTEPLGGWRQARVRERKTAVDWAHEIRWLLEDQYPEADCVVLVCDNLNTHKIASLYEAFPPEIARRLVERLEIHYTPKHGSWLNMAETELSVLTRQCLDRRIPDQPTLIEETNAWGLTRNTNLKTIDWRLTTADARIKLKRLYPQFHS